MRLLRSALSVLAFTVWTWFWLLPVAGFHHMFRCGVLGWAILDGENEEFEIRWSLLLLSVSVAAWVGGAIAASRVLRNRAPKTRNQAT